MERNIVMDVGDTLRKLGACGEARAWAVGHRDPGEAWTACPRADWLLWVAVRVGTLPPRAAVDLLLRAAGDLPSRATEEFKALHREIRGWVAGERAAPASVFSRQPPLKLPIYDGSLSTDEASAGLYLLALLDFVDKSAASPPMGAADAAQLMLRRVGKAGASAETRALLEEVAPGVATATVEFFQNATGP